MPRTQPEVRERWSLDGGQCINCLTVGLIAYLVPRDPWGHELYLALALLAFVGLAFLNHLFPWRLRQLTHAVKAAYTHVLFASLAEPGAWALPMAAVVVSIIDMLPLHLRGSTARSAFEALGAAARWTAIFIGIHRLGFPPWLVILLGACTLAYGWERRQRIARGRRHEYGLTHCLEHVAVWAWLATINAHRLDLGWACSAAGITIVAFALTLVGAGMVTNRWLLHRLLARLPAWFDPRLRPHILHKARANARSHRWQHYVLKPFAPTIANQAVRWRDIEQMLDQIEVPPRYDAVVGVLSGGGFIAPYLARRLGIVRICYARSRLWSELSIWRNLVLTLRYYHGPGNRPRATFLDPAPALAGRRVLVVDDSVCTGATMASVVDLCREHGAAEVATLTLYCSPDHPTDYTYCTSRTPLVWPWGWESD